MFETKTTMSIEAFKKYSELQKENARWAAKNEELQQRVKEQDKALQVANDTYKLTINDYDLGCEIDRLKKALEEGCHMDDDLCKCPVCKINKKALKEKK